MTTRREESDGRVLPEDRRKAVPPARNPRGGKATTASEQAGQRVCFPRQPTARKGPFPAQRRAEANRLDTKEAPQRELDQRRKQVAGALVAGEKARVANKAVFRP
jgi:hypothetical protein